VGKKIVMTIMRSLGGKYTPACLIALRKEYKIGLSQLTYIRLRIILATYHPETLDLSQVIAKMIPLLWRQALLPLKMPGIGLTLR